MKAMKIWTILLMATFIIACEKEDEMRLQDFDQVVFQAEFVNFAWGRVQKGFFITSDGTMYTYDKPEKWIFPDNGFIKQQDMKNNLGKCTKSGTVNLETLNRMKALILNVDENKLSEIKAVMADAGSEKYSFFIQNPSNNELHENILLRRGDFYQENSDEDAKIITDWLIELNQGGVFSDKFFK